jgi:hypothetical protein
MNYHPFKREYKKIKLHWTEMEEEVEMLKVDWMLKIQTLLLNSQIIVMQS